MTKTDRILDYLRAHGECGATEVAGALGLGKDAVAAILSQKRRKGQIERVRRDAPRGSQWPENIYRIAARQPQVARASSPGGCPQPQRRTLKHAATRPRSNSGSGVIAGLITIGRGSVWGAGIV